MYISVIKNVHFWNVEMYILLFKIEILKFVFAVDWGKMQSLGNGLP